MITKTLRKWLEVSFLFYDFFRFTTNKRSLLIFGLNFSAIKDYGVGVATIDEASVDTNLVFAKLHPEYVALDFVARMAKVGR